MAPFVPSIVSRPTAPRPGFSLLELLVVIAIIGVASTVGINGYQSAQDRSRNVQVGSNLHEVQTALEQYAARYQDFPKAVPGDNTKGLIGDTSTGPAFLINSLHTTAPANDMGFLPGERLPLSPWGDQARQKNNLPLSAALHTAIGAQAVGDGNAVAMKSALSNPADGGPGAMPVAGQPFTSAVGAATTYGAVVYDYDPRKFYVLFGCGKVGAQAQFIAAVSGSTP